MISDRPPEEEERLKALRRERFNNTEGERRYQQLVAERAKRRQQLVSQGVLHRQGALTEAAKIVGTCTLMCPEFEREERQLKNNIALPEAFPGTRQADPARTVKTFHRSAAGNEEPLPEDLRTPETLRRTLDHLVNVVIAADQELRSCHGFVRDRTRSIRQDFTIQNIRDQTTVAVCERIARFHIVSLHILCGNKDFAEHQDMEQLRNTLKTLIELYDDHRKARVPCPNEAEFYAYYVVSHLRDPDAKRVAERLPQHIFTAPVVQQALKLHMLSEANTVATRRDPGSSWAAQNLAVQFFRAVATPATPLLLACLAEYYFPSVRRAALKAMCDAFPYQEGKEYPVAEFAEMLAFDSVDEVRAFCAQFNVALHADGVKLGERVAGRIVFKEPAQQPRRQSPNLRVVGAKFHMSPMHAINSDLDQRLLGSTGRFSAADSGRPAASTRAAKPAFAVPPVKSHTKPVWPATPSQQSQQQLQPAFGAKPASAESAGSASAFASGHGGIFGKQSEPAFTVPSIQIKRKESAAESITESATQPLSQLPPPSQPPQPQLFGNLFSQASNKPAESVVPASMPVPATPATPATPLFAPPASTPAEKPVVAAPTAIAPAPPEAIPEPKPVSVVWNRPRHRINWTSLSNALYHDLIGSLTGEVAAPVTARAKRDVQTADTLAGDITQSIVDYTSAFVAYEESYRCLLFAQADAFRARTLRRRALAQWSMETVARLQDRALQQRYLDDLDDIIDSEYSSRPQTYMGDDDDVLGVTRAPAAPNPDTIAPRAAPEGFWDSLHMGAECFGTVSRALTRFGNPVFRAAVDVDGAQSTAVLSSWLWWQLDPASIERSDAGSRAASYGSDEQRLLFRDQVDERCVQNGDTAALAAQLVVLAAEPIGAADIRTPAAAVEGGLASTIVARVGRALDRARAVQPASGVHPLLFVFWSSGDTKAVRRLIERAASASGTPSFVAVNILALTVDSSKQQLSTGLKWICRHLLQTRKAALVKVARAYAPIVGALLQALQRICGCVRALANSEQPDAGTQTAVFNLAVDTVNAFLVLLNESLFRGAEGLRAGLYQHASEHEGLGRGYFDASGPSGSLPLDLNAVVAAMVDDILASDLHVYGHVSLGSCLRALEFVVKHQLDELQHAVPRSVYVDRRAITEATQATMRAAEQRLRQAAQLCQTNTMDWSPFVTPTAKRPSSLAFNGSPPSLDLGSVASTRDSAAMSVSTVSTPATSKRHRLTDSAQQLSRLQSAMARASKHLLD